MRRGYWICLLSNAALMVLNAFWYVNFGRFWLNLIAAGLTAGTVAAYLITVSRYEYMRA